MITTQDYITIIIRILGSLGLLIFGMRVMSESLQKMAGSQLRHILRRMTSNRITGIMTGTLVTCAVQSSSATTVMTVSFVSAGLLTLSQAISIIMGANIGTTLTAWIMSLGYSTDLTDIVFPAFLIGIILIYYKKQKNTGEFLFGLAFMFLSLVMLSSAGKSLDLEHTPDVVSFFASFDTGSHTTIILFLLIGTLITCVVQSSAAVMAITILLCSTGVLPIHLGIALVMGENIGTTATANLAALGAGNEARRAALAHLLFNVFGVVWVLCVFFPFVDLICHIAGYSPGMARQTEKLPVVLAMFHTCFNVANTLILVFFIPKIEKAVRYMLPDTKKGEQKRLRLQYIKTNLIQTPEIAVLEAQKETAHFGDGIKEMFTLVRELHEKTDDFDDAYKNIERLEDEADDTELSIAQFLSQVSNDHLSDETKNKIRQMMRIIGELESISDSNYKIAHILHKQKQNKQQFSERQISELMKMFTLCGQAIERMCTVLKNPKNEQEMLQTYKIENEINQMRHNMKNDNIRAINEHEYDYGVGIMYTDIVNECEKIGDYVVNVVQARLS